MKNCMRSELKELVQVVMNGESYCKVTLDGLADPKTVVAKLGNTPLEIVGFTIYGDPVFSMDIYDMYSKICTQACTTSTELAEANHRSIKTEGVFIPKVEITYQKAEVSNLSIWDFDTVEGIQKHIQCYNGFLSVIKARSRYIRANSHANLHQFVLFDKLQLGRFADNWFISNCVNENHEYKEVRTWSEYLSNAYDCYLEHTEIPTKDFAYAESGEMISYEDIKNGECHYDFSEGKFYKASRTQNVNSTSEKQMCCVIA